MLMFTVWCPLTELDVSDVYPSEEAADGSPGKGPNVMLPGALWVDPLPVWAQPRVTVLTQHISKTFSVCCPLLNHRLYGDPWFMWGDGGGHTTS